MPWHSQKCQADSSLKSDRCWGFLQYMGATATRRITYRRLHDWLKSWYSEIMRLYQLKLYKEHFFPSFTNWTQRSYDQFHSRHTVALQQKFEGNKFPVHIFHYHRQRDNNLLESLFCDILQALTTCNNIRYATKPA